jgi:predicted acetyltransferase
LRTDFEVARFHQAPPASDGAFLFARRFLRQPANRQKSSSMEKYRDACSDDIRPAETCSGAAAASVECGAMKPEMMTLELVKPSLERLPEYQAALERGWCRDNVRDAATVIREELEKIAADPAVFVAGLDDPQAKGGLVVLPDGTTVPRLPGFHRWIWDGGFCGSISIRWQPGTPALPPHVQGHIGYGVVPWRRGRGCATRALALMLIEGRCTGLPFVQVTADLGNAASQAVIRANGGRLVERFVKPAAFGGKEALRFHIDLKM